MQFRKTIIFSLWLWCGIASAAAGIWLTNSANTTQLIQQYATGFAAWVYNAYAAAGERSESSVTGIDYISGAEEWKATTIQTNAAGDIVVYAGPALVKMIRVRNTTDAGVATTNTAGIILVKDSSTVKDGAAAAKTPGSTIYDGMDGTQFRTNVTVNFANVLDNPASSGKIEVLYRAMPATVNW